MSRSKYNVTNDTEKRTYNDILFDSVMEMKYYRDVILPQVESGEIKDVELQPVYELQPKFTRDGKSVRAITYIADFKLIMSDGHIKVIEVKGMSTQCAQLKKKMFLYCYPEFEYHWVTYVKKFGGWVEYDDVKKLRRNEKKAKELEENTDEQEGDV